MELNLNGHKDPYAKNKGVTRLLIKKIIIKGI
jgi:hypothetical protein